MYTINYKIKPIHPFAARMAPEIAFKALEDLPKDALILDPMAGSGTVLRTISSLGFDGIGIDIDPLAVLMSKAWTTKVSNKGFLNKKDQILNYAENLDKKSIQLPWIDNCKHTRKFISFWFAKRQIQDLKRLSCVVNKNHGKYSPLLKVALSKMIITKKKGASLAADVSHSRPHRVKKSNDFDVLFEYKRTCSKLANLMAENSLKGKIKVSLGDARKIKIENNSVDAIITSPPYLNAIDYMRGHKLALVWLGYQINKLAMIRGRSLGAEKAPERFANIELAKKITANICDLDILPSRKVNMIYRYALDMYDVIRESSRVLKKNGRATFVIGNSSQHGVHIKNTRIVLESANNFGLHLLDIQERNLPQNKRYLPPPTKKEMSSFKNRMRTEAIMTFVKS